MVDTGFRESRFILNPYQVRVSSPGSVFGLSRPRSASPALDSFGGPSRLLWKPRRRAAAEATKGLESEVGLILEEPVPVQVWLQHQLLTPLLIQAPCCLLQCQMLLPPLLLLGSHPCYSKIVAIPQNKTCQEVLMPTSG
ncbi:uncharacterized protein LOC144216420 [Crocuta crocuta]